MLNSATKVINKFIMDYFLYLTNQAVFTGLSCTFQGLSMYNVTLPKKAVNKVDICPQRFYLTHYLNFRNNCSRLFLQPSNSDLQFRHNIHFDLNM